MKHLSTGFTLIELTIVLFIVGLLLAGLLAPLKEGIESERRAKTQEEQKTIEEALYGYAITNGRLPCPDCRNAGTGNCNNVAVTLNDGLEDVIGNVCAADPNAPSGDVIEGNLPWVTLSVSQFDAWESWYTYAVSDAAADIIGAGTAGTAIAGCVGTGENLATIDLCAQGDILIQNISGLCPLPPPAPFVQATIAQNVFAVVVSHGANIIRNPANTGLIAAPLFCSEIENNNQNATFISSNFINPGSPGGAPGGNNSQYGIDDLTIWISPHVLKNKLLQSGRLP